MVASRTTPGTISNPAKVSRRSFPAKARSREAGCTFIRSYAESRCYGVRREDWHNRRWTEPTRCPMPKPNDLSRSLTALEQDSTLIVVIEMSQASWLVAGIVPGVDREPLKKLEPNGDALLRLLQRWRDEATKAGRTLRRVAVAYEAGRDGFWLARWLRARGVEAYVIHPTSVAVSREHRRAKTDRLDTALLKRVFLGWLRGEPKHCSMAAIPTLAEEDARRPNREHESLVGERTRLVNRIKSGLVRLGIRTFKPMLRRAPEHLDVLRTPEGAPVPVNTLAELRRNLVRLHLIMEQIKVIEAARLERLQQAPDQGPHAMVRLLARVIGIGRLQTCWCRKCSRATCATAGRWRVMPA